MIVAAFLISTAGVLAALALIQGAQRAKREHAREMLAKELATFLEGAKATDDEHGSGSYEGMAVRLTLGHYEVAFEVQLEPAIIPYLSLVERHAPAELKTRLDEFGLTLDDKDRVVGSVPREPGLEENLVSVANRLPAIAAVAALRRHAPSELLARIDRARSSAEIDQLLLQLAEHFPHAPETQDAIELAAEREHGHPERVRQRAERWLARA
jgi:hypothetical protein